jgi:hypothetical protein
MVCGCPASKGGILRVISHAGRRFRASPSALVSGRKNHNVLCIYGAPFSYLRFRRLGSVVGPVRQVFLHSMRNLLHGVLKQGVLGIIWGDFAT